MARRRTLRHPKEHITRDILLNILKTGITVAVAVTAPNAVKMLAPPAASRKTPWEQYYPSSVNRQLTRLYRKGMVEVSESDAGYTVKISDRGKTEVLRYDLSAIEIPQQNRWDGKWRMVIFDIPGKEESVRAAFREHLKALGFFQMQKSAYVYPYPCEKQVKFLREVYGIPHSVKLATIQTLENDDDLRKVFHV